MTVKELKDILDCCLDDDEVQIDCIGDRDLSFVVDYYIEYGPVLKVSRVAPLLAEVGLIKRLIGGD